MARLVAEEAKAQPALNAAIVNAAVLQRISTSLIRFVGSDGARTILARALSSARGAHPVVQVIEPSLAVSGVAEAIDSHGMEKTAAGIEAVIGALLDLLGNLIGDELAMKLLSQTTDDMGSDSGSIV